jgi:hypothetical protein
MKNNQYLSESRMEVWPGKTGPYHGASANRDCFMHLTHVKQDKLDSTGQFWCKMVMLNWSELVWPYAWEFSGATYYLVVCWANSNYLC